MNGITCLSVKNEPCKYSQEHASCIGLTSSDTCATPFLNNVGCTQVGFWARTACGAARAVINKRELRSSVVDLINVNPNTCTVFHPASADMRTLSRAA